jgi:hypothetical protein
MLNCEIAMRDAETLVEHMLRGGQPTEAHMKRCIDLLKVGLEEITEPHIAWGLGNIQILRDNWDAERCALALDYIRHELVARSAEAGEGILEDLLVKFERANPS